MEDRATVYANAAGSSPAWGMLRAWSPATVWRGSPSPSLPS